MIAGKRLLFAVVAAVQLAVPGTLIFRHELALRTGQPYKFKTAPVDPYDAFRGRYVALNFEQRAAPGVAGEKLERGQKVCAHLEVDKDGFAKITRVTRRPPADKPYLRVHVLYGDVGNISFELPFNRYYMEEHAAPAAEQAYWQNNRRGQPEPAYAFVRIRAGVGVIENLYVAGKPIAEVIRKSAQP